MATKALIYSLPYVFMVTLSLSPPHLTPRLRLFLGYAALLALTGLSLVGCAKTIEVGRPEITFQGYKLAALPSASPNHFLGRRYGSDGMEGDKPCTIKDFEEAKSSQRLATFVDQKQLLNLDLSQFKVLGAGGQLGAERLEGVRMELTTTKRAAVTVGPGCGEDVIYDVVAGKLFVEYQFSASVDVEAKGKAYGLTGEGNYQFDENRNIISTTLQSDEYVAFRVYQPKDNRTPGLLYMGGGAAAFIGGAAADFFLANDGEDNVLEWTPVILYLGGLAASLYGYLLWSAP